MSTQVSWSAVELNNQPKPPLPMADIALSALTIVSFIAGVALCSQYPAMGQYADQTMNAVVSAYSLLAPVVIFCILAPSLHQVLSLASQKRVIVNAFLWLARKRLIACLFGVVFTVLIFGIKLWPNHNVNCIDTLIKTVQNLGFLAVHSPYFIALYISIAAAIAAQHMPWLGRIFHHMVEAIEKLGNLLAYTVPLLMLCMGAYVYQLPEHLKDSLPADAMQGGHLSLAWLGGTIQLGTPAGAIKSYFLIGALVGLACLIHHMLALIFTRFTVKGFSLRSYFVRYWSKVYPLLWATSSESLAMPLNLSLVRNIYPQVSPLLRRFVVGMGSWLNINGTLICVFVMAGAIAKMLGQNISALELLLAIPAVFLIGYGVPGMPGELILFAEPVSRLIGIPPEVCPVFVALYIGFNFGLADAFRSGHNSTDNCISALMLSAQETSLSPTPAFPAKAPLDLGGIGGLSPAVVEAGNLLATAAASRNTD